MPFWIQNNSQKRGYGCKKARGHLTPVPSVWLIFWCCFCFPELGMISAIRSLRLLIVQTLHQRHHRDSISTLGSDRLSTISNTPPYNPFKFPKVVRKPRNRIVSFEHEIIKINSIRVRRLVADESEETFPKAMKRATSTSFLHLDFEGGESYKVQVRLSIAR